MDGVRYEYKNEKKDSTAKGNAIGKWKYTAEIEALSVQANGVISFADSKDNYTGTITVDINRSTNELSDITFEKNKITFSFIFIDEDNEETSVTASLNVDNDTFEGTFTTEALGTFPVEGSKVDDPD